MPVTVGFIGAGRIGEPMVERLVASGRPVRVYARRDDVRARLAAAGAELVDEPAAVADADAVVSCLYSDDQLLEVGPVLVDRLRPGAVLVSHTTGTTAALETLAAAAGRRGAGIVAAPFSGTDDAVRAGRLTVYLGGTAGDVAVAAEVVAAYAGTTIRFGDRAAALRFKLLNNLAFAAISQVTLRVLDAARRMGLEEQAVLDGLAAGSGASAAAGYVAALGGAGPFAEFTAPFLRKDLDACRVVADESGVDLSALLAAAREGPLGIAD